MTRTLTALFDHYAGAERAVHALEAAGISQDDISIVANHAKNDDALVAEDAGKGGGLGALVGGTGGLLAALGLLVIPGVGPAVAAGWLGSMLVGAAAGGTIGAAAGGLVGALAHADLPEEQAHVYAEGVRRGGALVTARVADEHLAEAETILGQQGSAVDPDRRAALYRKQGWDRFDDTAPAYTREQIEAEHAGYVFV